MKQVFQADDGTIFEKEIACEKYESSKAYRESLIDGLYEVNFAKAEMIVNDLELLHNLGLANKIVNFIKSLGENNAN